MVQEPGQDYEIYYGEGWGSDELGMRSFCEHGCVRVCVCVCVCVCVLLSILTFPWLDLVAVSFLYARTSIVDFLKFYGI